jgi:hypothetical protein
VHHRVDEHLLVAGGQLRHVAKVHVRDAAVVHREDVAGVRVAVEQPELQPRSTAVLQRTIMCWNHRIALPIMRQH